MASAAASAAEIAAARGVPARVDLHRVRGERRREVRAVGAAAGEGRERRREEARRRQRSTDARRSKGGTWGGTLTKRARTDLGASAMT
jgi:hypothetical protein